MPPTPPPTPPRLDQNVGVLEINEAFDDINGSVQFTGTLIVYRGADNKLHHAVSKARYASPSEVRAEHLINDIVIPVSAYCPPFSAHFTRAPGILTPDIHVKMPRLIGYDRFRQGTGPENYDSILKEVEVCEILKRHPHPNIAAYFGCQVASNGGITGICFAKYDYTLMQMANPWNLMKRISRAVRGKTGDYSHILEGVERGIKHLHRLGLVHNDINPNNIMLDGDVPIIIDFGSCRRIGESLEDIGRTYEWHDENIQRSLPKNDLDALEEIRIWLGDGSSVFQFE